MDNIKKHKVTGGFCFIICIFILCTNFSFSQYKNKKNVLVLNSYHRGYEWTESIEEGIKSVLGGKENNTEISIEYMDTKRHTCGMYLKKLYEVYKDKYKNAKLDMIIATDDDALDFLIKYGEELFPNTPVVFCGVENLQDIKLRDHKLFTGVIEEINIKDSISMVQKIHPKTKNIIFIMDQTTSGITHREKINKLKLVYKDLNFILWDDMQISKIEEKVKTLQEDSIIFFMPSILQDDFRNIMPADSMEIILENSHVPVYSFWDMFLNHGIIGGLLISGQEQGKTAAEIAKGILKGENVENIPIVKETTQQYVFDYEQMKKFGINRYDLPEGSILINEPPNVYSIQKEMAYNILMLIIMMLIIIMVVLVRNILRRKEIEKKLEDHLQFMNMLIDTIPNPVFYKNTQGIYIGCNKSFEEFIGLDRENIVGYGVYHIFHKELADIYYKMDNELMNRGGHQIYDEKIHNQDDTYRDVIFYKGAYKNSEGKVDGLVGVIVDITERKKAEEKIRESEEQYRTLIELLPDGIIAYDEEQIEFVNRAGIKLLGAENQYEIIGKSMMSFIHEDYSEIVKKRIRQVKEEKIAVPPLEQKSVRADGKLIDVEAIASPFPNKGIMKQIAVIRDITERKKAEALQKRIMEAEEQDKLKTEFFANLSHELRTPLNVIFSSIQLLELELKNCFTLYEGENLKKRIKILKQNSYRLLRLVNNLIDITKMDSGYFELEMKNHNIVSIVEEITLSVAEYIEQKQISLQFDTDVEEKIMVCDPDKIERIILNLLSNAVKFTNPGGRIMVNLFDRGKNIEILVKDTGIGIPKDKIEIIFERFRQVDKSLRRNHEGSGIGLSLVESLVKMHGGNIHVESEYGKGSTFIIELPAKTIDEGELKIANKNIPQNYAERIDIEFSDIYA